MNGQTCTNDILGNRLTKGSNTYGWDALNRMTSYNANTYQYRADGMRTKKVVGSATTTYRYDGQMGMQDVEVNGSTTTVTDYALGARGVDAISKSVNGAAATVSFPLYDAHGNTIGTLARSGSSFTTANERYYDAWGAVNFGGTTGDPKGRYCASIGHKQDDESGLIYMRARYYEPSSGRFVSEDPAMDGGNWFSYCGGDSVNFADRSGRSSGNLGEEEGAITIGETLDGANGSAAFNFKSVAQSRIKSIFTSQKYGNRNITDAEARRIIHALKESDGVGPADDLLFDFAKQMFGRQTGEGIECLGTLRQIIDMFL